MRRVKGQDLLGIGGILWAICVLTGYVHVASPFSRYGSALGGLVIFVSWVARRRAERIEEAEERRRAAQTRR